MFSNLLTHSQFLFDSRKGNKGMKTFINCIDIKEKPSMCSNIHLQILPRSLSHISLYYDLNHSSFTRCYKAEMYSVSLAQCKSISKAHHIRLVTRAAWITICQSLKWYCSFKLCTIILCVCAVHDHSVWVHRTHASYALMYA